MRVCRIGCQGQGQGEPARCSKELLLVEHTPVWLGVALNEAAGFLLTEVCGSVPVMQQ